MRGTEVVLANARASRLSQEWPHIYSKTSRRDSNLREHELPLGGGNSQGSKGGRSCCGTNVCRILYPKVLKFHELKEPLHSVP
jgi:hypothetical protein